MGFHGRKESWVTIICVTISYLVFKTIEKVAYFGKICMFLFTIFTSRCVAWTEQPGPRSAAQLTYSLTQPARASEALMQTVE